MDLLFTTDLTVPSNLSKNTTPINFANNTDYIIWEPGISQNAKFQEPNTEIDCNRLEILRFLNVLCSQCLYKSISNIIPVGSRYLTVLVTSIDKIEILTFISSLLNLTCRSTKSDTRVNGLEFSNSKFKELRTLMVTNAIQLLTLCVVYPLPKLDLKFLIDLKILESKPINLVRFYCAITAIVAMEVVQTTATTTHIAEAIQLAITTIRALMTARMNYLQDFLQLG
ncbi:unnamed protein product [[Candida] boidinii]|nr:unnamed protein product [[Candida] boidinii]